MTLSNVLLKYLDDQIAAGLSAGRLQEIFRYVNTVEAVDPAEVAQYLYGRVQADGLLQESLRLALLLSLTDDRSFLMPDDMDARIRQRLFGQSVPADPPAPPVQGRDQPELVTINTPWDAVIYNKVAAYQRAWEDAPRVRDRATARRYMILWRAIERINHLDFTALEELQAEHEQHALDAEFVDQLRLCREQLLKMVDGIDRLVGIKERG
jgi:hypothetical protein